MKGAWNNFQGKCLGCQLLFPQLTVFFWGAQHLPTMSFSLHKEGGGKGGKEKKEK